MVRPKLLFLAICDMLCLGIFSVLVMMKIGEMFIVSPLLRGFFKVCTDGNITIAMTSRETLKNMLKDATRGPLSEKESQAGTSVLIYLFGCLIWLIANFFLIYSTKDVRDTPKEKKIVYLKRWSKIMLIVIFILYIALRNGLMDSEIILMISLAYRFYLVYLVGNYKQELKNMVNTTRHQESSTPREINIENLGKGVKVNISGLGDGVKVSIVRIGDGSEEVKVIKGDVPIEIGLN